MSEDEITKGSVMVQMKAAEKPFCCGTVYYTKYHIRWFGFWVWLCNLIQWHDHSNEISLFAILTCTKGKIIFFLFALIKKIYQNLGSFYCNFGVLRFETVNCTACYYWPQYQCGYGHHDLQLCSSNTNASKFQTRKIHKWKAAPPRLSKWIPSLLNDQHGCQLQWHLHVGGDQMPDHKMIYLIYHDKKSLTGL